MSSISELFLIRVSSFFAVISVYILFGCEYLVDEHTREHRSYEYEDIGIEEYDTPDRRTWTESADSPSDTE